MPLDDREQQILAELERSLYEQHPDLARVVGKMKRAGCRYGLCRVLNRSLIDDIDPVSFSLGGQGFRRRPGKREQAVYAWGLGKGVHECTTDTAAGTEHRDGQSVTEC